MAVATSSRAGTAARRPLQVAVIGIGFGQHVHVPAFRADPRCRVAMICASDAQRAQQVATRLQIPRASGDWRAIVHDPEIDIIALAVPPAHQVPIALAALQAGKHLFCEKPLATTLTQAETVATAANAAAVVTAVNFELTELPPWSHAMSLVAEHRLGEIQSIIVEWFVRTLANRQRRNTWKTSTAEGGGALMGFGAHVFYYLERLVGPVIQLQADLHGAHDDQRAGDTAVTLQLESATGATGMIRVETDCTGPPRHHVCIVGSHGSLSVSNDSPDYVSGFKLTVDDVPHTIDMVANSGHEDGRVLATSALVRRFVAAVADGNVMRPSIADGLRVQRLLDAALRSYKQGQAVTV